MLQRLRVTGLAVVALLAGACHESPTLGLPEGAIDLAAPWALAGAGVVGVDDAALVEAADVAVTIPRLRSLLVVRRGRLIFEHYYGGFGVDSVADVRSVTKSLVSTLTGIALERGEISSLDQPITDFLPELESHTLPEHSAGDHPSPAHDDGRLLLGRFLRSPAMLLHADSG